MNGNQTSQLPNVSVVVPVYNAEKTIAGLIESLLSQDYPKELVEIIIVDNNSTDKSRQIIQEYPVELLEEKESQGPGAPRNKGVRRAKGQILAFVDSDCTATAQWLKEGVKKILSESADLVGGQVKFRLSAKKTPAEIFDSLTNMQIEHNIKDRSITKTSNLFVRPHVFDRIGFFPSHVESGEDVRWTGKATRNGFSLVYAPEAIIEHPARRLKELLKKQYKVGRGMIAVWAENKRSKLQMIHSTIVLFKPTVTSFVRNIIARRGTDDMHEKFWRICGAAYLCRLATAAGIITSVLSYPKKAEKTEPVDEIKSI